ncbi:chemotaxis protein CheA [Desulfovibrio inopinatus]|uniref:chemotaxis protein CheA n=1 Tax=Desulfovibrio inopinatus TaxID=102109 RepID=UPI00041A6972|nr:chemotaxis protein CheA [Desulfovibrio inopinatus]
MDMQSLFLEEVREQLQELGAALFELDADHGDKSRVDRIFRAIHTIKGACSMFGVEGVVSLAHDVETVYDKVRKGELHVTKELIDLTFAVQDQMAVMLEKQDGDVDEEKTLELLTGVQALLDTGEAPVMAVHAETTEDDSTETSGEENHASNEPLDTTPSPVSATSNDTLCTYHVRLNLVGPGVLEQTDPQSILDELRNLGDVVVMCDDSKLPLLDDLDIHDGHLVWHVFISTPKKQDLIEDVLFFVNENQSTIQCIDTQGRLPEESQYSNVLAACMEHGRVSEEDYAALLEAEPTPIILSFPPESETIPFVSEPSPVAPADFKPVQATEEPRKSASTDSVATPSSPSTSASTPRPQSAQSIRVEAVKLDNLVNLVGELVIAQARLTQIAASIGHLELTSVAEEIEHLSNDLRDNTLSVRMLPIGTTFSRFRRLVRDLSAELHKEIELVTEGGETELDKTVIEQLNDPLVHLLRNSIDHGIEPPEQRVAVGKPPQGRIVLSAEHVGGEVVVRIVDDGKGIDPKVIRDKAIEKGLLSPDVRLSDTETFALIFQPGFSTAERVTSVSGRGVGMDVVKRSMDALRGKIDIQSEYGVGTTLTIKLPLTLAIIDGLQVRASNEMYIIPLAAVEECVELSAAERDSNVRNRTLHLRGELVPYLRLRETFALAGPPPPLEQIVITWNGQKRVGIAVDEVLGQQQTVIKSLGRAIGNVEGISGATVNGDGSMSLILDIQTLIASTR